MNPSRSLLTFSFFCLNWIRIRLFIISVQKSIVTRCSFDRRGVLCEWKKLCKENNAVDFDKPNIECRNQLGFASCFMSNCTARIAQENGSSRSSNHLRRLSNHQCMRIWEDETSKNLEMIQKWRISKGNFVLHECIEFCKELFMSWQQFIVAIKCN